MKYILWFFLVLLLVVRFITTRPNYHDGDKIRLTAKVGSEPIRYSFSQRLILKGLKVYLPLYPEINYQDKVVVEGIVDHGKLKKAKLVKIKQAVGILPKTRSKIIKIYQKALPEPHSSLMAGVVLGSKQTLPAYFWQALRKTGTAHVVVASGMNVTLVAKFLITALVLFLPRRKALPMAMAGIWGYSLLSGMDAPIIRAAIMGSITFTAQEVGRLSSAWSALFLSALIMLMVKPDWLFDLGFILSFVATTSLIAFERKISRLIHFVPSVIREDLATSLAAQIGVAPILWATFGQFSLVSPLVNTFVLWTIPIMTIIGMVGGIVGLFVPLVARLILFLSFPLTSWFVWVIKIFG
jgi:competence protein ComEC